MADLGAEFRFQVIAERAAKTAVILTTNLPFSKWTQVISNGHIFHLGHGIVFGTPGESVRAVARIVHEFRLEATHD
jgi:uroporphyrinogen-III decarboxylase